MCNSPVPDSDTANQRRASLAMVAWTRTSSTKAALFALGTGLIQRLRIQPEQFREVSRDPAVAVPEPQHLDGVLALLGEAVAGGPADQQRTVRRVEVDDRRK